MSLMFFNIKSYEKNIDNTIILKSLNYYFYKNTKCYEIVFSALLKYFAKKDTNFLLIKSKIDIFLNNKNKSKKEFIEIVEQIKGSL